MALLMLPKSNPHEIELGFLATYTAATTRRWGSERFLRGKEASAPLPFCELQVPKDWHCLLTLAARAVLGNCTDV